MTPHPTQIHYLLMSEPFIPAHKTMCCLSEI